MGERVRGCPVTVDYFNHAMGLRAKTPQMMKKLRVPRVPRVVGEKGRGGWGNYAYNLINFLFLFLIKEGPLSLFVNGTLCMP